MLSTQLQVELLMKDAESTKEDSLLILDARPPEEYDKGHIIKGNYLLDISEIFLNAYQRCLLYACPGTVT